MKNISELLSKLTLGAIKLPEEVSQPPISRTTVEKALSQRPRRICFASTHQTALKEETGGKFLGKFSVPFSDTVYPLFYRMTGLELYRSKQYDNWWRSLKTTGELITIKNWMACVKSLVFLRDQLALSIALAEHLTLEGGRSTIGELEYQAKYYHDTRAIQKLTELCLQTINALPYYADSDMVCAVPPRQGKGFDLPSEIAKQVAAKLGKEDLTTKLSWNAQKPSLKDESFNQKWAKLEAVGLTVGLKITATKVLLIDDLYQSGITIQFVAMHLLEAGAKQIYGLALVKSRGDSDNT